VHATLETAHRSNIGARARTTQQITPSSDAARFASVDAGRMGNQPHETERAVEKLHELEHIADVGESPETPLILLGEVWVVCALVVLVILALSLIAYRLAT